MWPLVLGYHTKKRNPIRQAQTVPTQTISSSPLAAGVAWGSAAGVAVLAAGSQVWPALLAPLNLWASPAVGTVLSLVGAGLIGGVCGAMSAKIITTLQRRRTYHRWPGLAAQPHGLHLACSWWETYATGPAAPFYQFTQNSWGQHSQLPLAWRAALLLQWGPLAQRWQRRRSNRQWQWQAMHEPCFSRLGPLAQTWLQALPLAADERRAVLMAARTWATPALLPLNAGPLALQLVEFLQNAAPPGVLNPPLTTVAQALLAWLPAALQSIDFRQPSADPALTALHLGEGVVAITPQRLGEAWRRFIPFGALGPVPLGAHHPLWPAVRAALQPMLLNQWGDLKAEPSSDLCRGYLGAVGQVELIILKFTHQQQPLLRRWADQLPLSTLPLLPVLRPQTMLETFRRRAASL